MYLYLSTHLGKGSKKISKKNYGISKLHAWPPLPPINYGKPDFSILHITKSVKFFLTTPPLPFHPLPLPLLEEFMPEIFFVKASLTIYICRNGVKCICLFSSLYNWFRFRYRLFMARSRPQSLWLNIWFTYFHFILWIKEFQNFILIQSLSMDFWWWMALFLIFTGIMMVIFALILLVMVLKSQGRI